jgi:PAS domain S-box-containing protein
MTTARILVVEDQAIVAKDIENKLQKVGYVVPAIAFSGEEAIQRAAETRPDLVLMDIRLSGEMDGIEAAEEIRVRFDIPVVYLTGYADEETVQRAKVTEPFGYVLKPFEARELRSAIEVALYKHEMDKKLKESEERYRQLVETMNEALAVTDQNYVFTYVNERFCEMLGYSRDELIGRHLIKFVHDDYREFVKDQMTRRRRGEAKRYEMAWRTKDGSEIFTIGSPRGFFDEQGRFAGSFGVLTDITERTPAEEALRRSLKETAHGQRLLLALSQAAQAVERARMPDEVHQTVGDELARLGYHALVFTLTDDRAHLSLSHHTFEPAPLRAAEKLAGRSAQGYHFPLVPDGFFQRVIAEGQTTFTERTAEHMAETLPGPLRPLAGRLAALLGLEQSIVAPLMVGGETVGLLVVSGTGLTKADVPAITAFANQAAIAIENARLYEAEAQRRQEAESLRQAATVLTSTLDFEQVLDYILEQVSRVVPNDATNIMLIEGDEAHIVRWRGYERFGGEECASTAVFRISEVPNLQQILESREPMVTPDTATYPGWVHVPVRGWPRSHAAAPIIMRGEVIGFLNVNSAIPGFFTQAHVGLLRAFANQAAIAIENAWLYQEIVRQLKEAETLGAVTTALTRSLDLDQVLHSIVDSATRLIYAGTGGVIHLVDEAMGKLIPRATVAPGVNAQERLEMSIGEGIAGLVVQEERPINVPNAEEDPRFLAVDIFSPNKSLLSAPLLIDEDCIGTLSLNSNQVGAFSADDERLLTTLAAQAAVAVKNARLFEQAQRDTETKTTLLDEVNHRVKNNLSAIVGLLYAERRHAAMEDQAVYQSIIHNMSNRVQGLDTVHSLLSASEWAPLSLSELAGQVIRSSLQMLPRDKSISIDVTPSPVRVTPDQAHDLALVINELATNTIKHTLEDRQAAQITVRVGLDDDTVLFEFRDDGPGYPEEVLQLERHNVGFYLIQRIVRKTLRGELALHNDRGAVTTIRFKNQAKALLVSKTQRV